MRVTDRDDAPHRYAVDIVVELARFLPGLIPLLAVDVVAELFVFG